MAASRTRRTPKKAAFLDELRTRGNVSDACQAAGIPRRTAYDWRQADRAFADAWDVAIDEASDALEREAHRRAIEGVEEPVFYQGAEVGSIRRYSDTLLIFLLKAARPERYRERGDVRHDGSLTIRVEYANSDPDPAPPAPGAAADPQ